MISDSVIRAYVFIEGLDVSPVICGVYQLDIKNKQGYFGYGQSYLERQNAFPLDPIHLPLIKGTFKTNPHSEIFGVLRDAGPDSWGRRVILSLHKTKPRNEIEFLLAGAGEGVGALMFSLSRSGTKPKKPRNQLSDIKSLINIKESILTNGKITPEALKVFEQGSSMMIGGARPKTTLFDNGINYIVKFNRNQDLFDNVMVEHATMKMLNELEGRVAVTKPICSDIGNILLVERFDMNESRITSHFISAASLLEQINNKVGKLAATQSYTYGALAEFIRHNGKRPEQSMELYQRMVFNAFIGNVDDHTRNHAMLYDFVEQGWFLSPAYDVLPIKNEKSHSLGLGDEGRVATIENLLSQSKRFGLRTDKASKIIRNTRELVSSWPTYFKNEGVNDIDLSILESVLPDIDSW